MTTFKRYLSYRLKKSLLPTVFFTLIAALNTFTIVYTNVKPFAIIGNPEYNGNTGIGVLFSVMLIAAMGIPMLETAGLKNKQNIDTIYSLPLSRFQLALAHYVSGAVQMLVIYTASFITLVLTVLPYAQYFRLEYLPAYYLLSIVCGVGMYSFYMFIFGEANTAADGAIFCAMWTFGGVFLLGYAIELIEGVCYDFIPTTLKNDFLNLPWQMGGAYSPLSNLTTLFIVQIEPKADYAQTYALIMRHLWSFAVWAGIYAASAFGYFRTFIRKGAEKAGEASDTWLGYKLLIPIYGFMAVGVSEGILLIIWLALMTIGYIIYRRGWKLRKSDIVTLAIYAAIYLLLAGIMGLERAEILFFAIAILFVVSLCLSLRAMKDNREKPGTHGEKEMMKLLTLLTVSGALLIMVAIALSWPLIILFFSFMVI